MLAGHAWLHILLSLFVFLYHEAAARLTQQEQGRDGVKFVVLAEKRPKAAGGRNVPRKKHFHFV